MFGAWGNWQVGFTLSNNSVYSAILWNGTGSSAVNLTPAGFFQSRAYGVFADQQVGSVTGNFSQVRACKWAGSAASWVDLHPAGAQASVALGIHGEQQFGYATIGTVEHAGLWNGTAASFVDLHPAAGASTFNSKAVGGYAGQQVGFVEFRSSLTFSFPHASLWTGTAASWVDLHRPEFTRSEALAVHRGRQVGYARISSIDTNHAVVWSGTAASWEDISGYLPGGWSGSTAEAIWSDATTLYIAGSAYNTQTQRTEAVLWTRPISCAADFDLSSSVGVEDVFVFLAAWFATDVRADFNAIGGINQQDIFDFLNAWFAGC